MFNLVKLSCWIEYFLYIQAAPPLCKYSHEKIQGLSYQMFAEKLLKLIKRVEY